MGMNMKEILSILLIIFIALAGIACVSASDINEAVDQDFIVSDLNETLIPIDDSTVLSDTNLGNDTVEDPDSTEIDNSTEPSQEDIVVDNSTEVVEVVPNFIITETKHGFVCANAAIDESNVDQIAEAIRLLKNNTELRKTMSERALEESKKFRIVQRAKSIDAFLSGKDQ